MKKSKSSGFLAIILALLAGVALYFGGGKEITWLCIVGFVLLLFAFLEAGVVGKLTTILVIVFLGLSKAFDWFTTSSYPIIKWLFIPGISLYSIARVALMICAVLVLTGALSANDQPD